MKRTQLLIGILSALAAALLTCPRAKASPLLSDGDETTNIGTVQGVRR